MWMTITIVLIAFLLNGAEYGESDAACKLEKNKKTIRFIAPVPIKIDTGKQTNNRFNILK